MHRFFLTDRAIVPGQFVDLSPLAHQLSAVLRLQAGAQIVLLDGQNSAYATELVQVERKRATGKVLTRTPVVAEPSVHLTLYQCSLKADKLEWVLQKGTELGVSRFVPVISARSVVRPASALFKKHERWRAIIREAAEQCGRGRLPELVEPMMWEEAIAHADATRLLPWEEARESVRLHEHLATLADETELNLLIGPEGGITPEEAHAAQNVGWQAVSLGPRILRAETAAIAGVALVTALGERSDK